MALGRGENDMGKKQEEVALKFIGYFRDSWPANLDDPLELVEDDCYYQSIVPTTDPIRGKAAIKAKWEKIRDDYGDQRHEMKGVGSSDRFVFTERVDYTKPADKWIPIPLVAVFEVNERGKIYAWREYLDGGNVARQIGIDVEQLENSLKSGKK
jgi:limonene-1,2-epoxide hydrolase